MKFTLLLPALAFSSGLALGQVALPTLSLRDFTASTSEAITWSLPQAIQPIQWRSVPSSFTRQGIRTFIAQLDGRPVGSLAVSSTGEVSGSLSLGGNFRIEGDPQTGELRLLPLAASAFNCPLEGKEAPASSARSFRATETENKPIFSDGYFRTLRLAVLFSNEDYEAPEFQRSTDKIEAWLAALETYLNTAYTRELGVQFTIVKHPGLYKTGLARKNIYLENSTEFINKIISSEAYDIGISLVNRGEGRDIAGLASLHGVSYESRKGAAWVSVPDHHTIAHELGHLLGGYHTYGKNKNGYSETGGGGDGSEPGSGTSILSYGQSYAGHFLCLSTLLRMVPTLRNADYLHPEGSKHFTETNTAPVIDRSKMKAEYIVPRGTFFSIPVYASDREQSTLTYSSYEEGGSYYKPVQFIPISAQHSNRIEFYRRYGTGGSLMPNTAEVPVGTYKIRLAVSDALPYQEAIQKRQAPLYDSYLATVKVVDVEKPFKMTEGLRSSYKAGEKFTLKWDVDPVFFKERKGKVRVLFSADRGKTYRPLVPATANDGECEVILPLQPVGWEYTYGITTESGQFVGIYATNKGLLRLETIDDGYFDLSPNQHSKGIDDREGIELKETAITFAGLPSTNYLQLPAEAKLPDAPTVTATSGGKSLQVTLTETTEDNIVRRLWSATDGKETAHFAQYIERVSQAATPSPEQPKEETPQAPKEEQPAPPTQPETPKPAEPETPAITPVEETSLAPSFSLRFEGDQLHLSGTKAGARVYLWDFSGKLLSAHPTTEGLTVLTAPATPLFLVQIGREVIKARRP